MVMAQEVQSSSDRQNGPLQGGDSGLGHGPHGDVGDRGTGEVAGEVCKEMEE